MGLILKSLLYIIFSGDNIYSDYADAASTRCASYDGEHVLVVSRATQPHLLKVSDLKKGEINPILLDLTGVSGGTFSYNMGALSNGHVYLSSLSGPKLLLLRFIIGKHRIPNRKR